MNGNAVLFTCLVEGVFNVLLVLCLIYACVEYFHSVLHMLHVALFTFSVVYSTVYKRVYNLFLSHTFLMPHNNE